MSDTKDDGGQAFPTAYVNADGETFKEPGMSRRDWIAGQVAAQMAGSVLVITSLVAVAQNFPGADAAAADVVLKTFAPPLVAEAAYEYADAVIAAGKGTP